MSSAVPYNPEDFDSNNPLGESPFAVPAMEPSQNWGEEPFQLEMEATPPPKDGAEAVSEVSLDEPTLPTHTITAIVSDKELYALLPERFGTKANASIVIKVTGTERTKRENPIFTFDVKVANLEGFRKAEYKEVRRSYAALRKFQAYLEVANLEAFVPSVPPAVLSHSSNPETEATRVWRDVQEWLDFITQNPVLRRDEEFVHFVECDFDYSVINANDRTPVASGLKRKTLKQLAPPYDSFTELAEFRPFVKSVHLSGLRLTKQMDRIARDDLAVATAVAELASSFLALAEGPASTARMWQRVAKALAANADLHAAQAVTEQATLGDEWRVVASDAYIIKESLTNRHLIMRELIQAQDATKSCHAKVVKIKNKSVIDPLRVDEAIKALESATRVERNLTLQVKRISGEMILERTEIIRRMETRLERAIGAYTLSRIDTARKMLRNLESIRADVRSVDSRGGLSRLGRDHLPATGGSARVDRSDSWSGRKTRASEREPATDEKDTEVNEVLDAKSAASMLGTCTF